jgi:outer membrane protein assembly factor BamB
MKALMLSIFAIVMSVLLSTQSLAGTHESQNVLNSSIMWKFKTNGSIHASALIDNGVIYIGSRDSSFYAINALTGVELWHFKSKDQIYTTAVKNENTICFESGNVLYGLNLQGALQWQFTLYDGAVVNQNDQWDYYRSSPRLVGNTVYIGSEKGLVFGVDITTGTKTFQCQVPEAKFAIKTTPAIYDNKIYVGDWDGVFYSFNLSDGTVAWKFDTKTDGTFTWVTAIVTDPVIYKDAIYFGGRSCRLYCFDPKTGTKKWSYRDTGDMWIVGGPNIVDDVVYTGSSYQHVVRMVNALTGQFIKDASATYRVNGKPLVDGNYIYVGTEADEDTKIGTLLILDKATGEAKGKLNIGAQVYSSPILNNGTIYFGATNGFVYAVNKEEFLNTPYPDTYMTCPNKIDFGKLQNVGSCDTTIYVSNKGLGTDSIIVTSALLPSQVTFEPASFKLAPNDSQAVAIKINLAGLNAKKYTGQIIVTSYNGPSLKMIKRAITFTVENVSDVESDNNLPKNYSLSQNYPNPFNPSTLIQYELPASSNVVLKVYDIMGREVATLVDEYRSAGSYQIKWNAEKLTSGTYIYTLKAGGFIKSGKMLLMK